MKPVSCVLSITDRCVLKCKMCHKWRDVVPEAQPTLEQYKNFIFNLKRFVGQNFWINFAGGEVLLSPGVLELVKFSVENGFLTKISSNGWLIDEDMAKRIADSGLGNIFLSLDSLNAETHDFLRGTKGAFQKVTNAIEYLSRHSKNLKIHIITTMMGINLEDVLDLARWVIQDGRLSSINFQAVTQPFNTEFEEKWYQQDKYSFLWPQDIKKTEYVLDELIELKKENQEKINNAISQFRIFKSYFKDQYKCIKKSPCHIDKKVINIIPSGEMFICHRMSPIGSIKQDGFDVEKVWNSAQADLVRNNIAKCLNNCQDIVNAYYDENESYISEKQKLS